MHHHCDFTFQRSDQRGIALVIALIFLLLLTILGVTAMTTSSLQEKMAGNVKDQTVAFQAAEAALRVGENWILSQTGAPAFPDANGLYVPISTSANEWWELLSTWTPNTGAVVYPGTPGTPTTSGALSSSIVARQPEYIIEDLGQVPDQNGPLGVGNNQGSHLLRVTAIGYGGMASTIAMVQSTVAVKW